MITEGKKLDNQSFEQYFEQLACYFTDKTEQILFFDIETTGFSARTTYCYLIGCIYYKDHIWQSMQWFAENADEESAVISTFFKFMQDFYLLIHFNGESFDMPYLLERCRRLHLEFDFTSMKSVDLYKKVKPLQKLLKLENYKQKSIEQFLGVTREDRYTGGELIATYQKYVQTREQEALTLLLLHNHDDLCGLTSILPILGYSAIADGIFSLKELVLHDAADYEGNSIKEAIFNIELPLTIPVQVSYGIEPFYMTAYQHTLKLRVKLYTGELKYFYKNYRDYYYLPGEDRSIHKSVAFYVDKNFRTQAKAANCYSKKTGMFLQQLHEIISPCFQIELTDKHSYFEVDDAFLKDSVSQLSYVRDILGQII